MIGDSFQDDGFVGPIEILSQEEMKQVYQDFTDWKLSLPDKKVTGDLRFKPHLYLDFCNRIARHSKLVHAVQQALDTTNILLWSSDFNIKEPSSSSHSPPTLCFPPHQDSTYAGLSPSEKCLTAWVAISDPVGEREGCLSFWKGSHKRGQLPHVEEPSDDNMLSRGQRLAAPSSNASQANYPRVLVQLRGGEATLHQFYTVHSSGPNQSTRPRVGLALRYMDASVKQTGNIRETVTLVSGSLQHDGFDLEPNLPSNPTEADILIGKEAHAKAMQREAANYFHGAGTHGYDEAIAA